MTGDIPGYLRGNANTRLLIEAMERIEAKIQAYMDASITWYTDDHGVPTHNEVVNPVQGDMFLYTQSGNLYQYNDGAWRFLATLNTSKPPT